ncbi:hypothetical protein KBI5_14870 [Frankia sp. KB5]|nr:hypothetical protein KBI5_14870 [Frankia sp. KB5]
MPALVATITAVLAGTASEAGAHVWNSLVDLVRRTFGAGSRERELVESDLTDEEDADAESVDDLARHLAARALLDPDFADALRSWTTSAQSTPTGDGSVTNIVGGNARIDGGLLQARDVHGSITLGGTDHGR